MSDKVKKPRGFCYDKDQFSKDKLIEFIDGRKRRLKKNQAQLGEVLGMTQQAFGYHTNRDKGNANFEFIHLVKLFKELNASDEEILWLMKSE